MVHPTRAAKARHEWGTRFIAVAALRSPFLAFGQNPIKDFIDVLELTGDVKGCGQLFR